MVIIAIIAIIVILHEFLIVFPPECLESVGSRILFELDHKKPILYVLPIENILGKLPVVPVGDTGTIPFRLRKHFEGTGASADPQNRPGTGCQMWYVNSWARGWSRDM